MLTTWSKKIKTRKQTSSNKKLHWSRYFPAILEKYKIDFVVLLQACHQSFRSAGSFAGRHAGFWFSVAITRRFHLHICNP